MTTSQQIKALAWAALLSAIDALDLGLLYQLEWKDDATLALWTAVGVEAVTLSVVLGRDPIRAFAKDQMPSPDELEALDFRTHPLPEMTESLRDCFPDAPYPEDALDFAGIVRNKILHTAMTMHAGARRELTSACAPHGRLDERGRSTEGVSPARAPG